MPHDEAKGCSRAADVLDVPEHGVSEHVNCGGVSFDPQIAALEIEPHHAQQAVRLSTFEKICDPIYLYEGRDSCLGDEDGIVSNLAYLAEGCPKEAGELNGWGEIVPVDADPGDVARSRPPLLDRSHIGSAYDVDRPHPLDIA